jgi:3-oxoacyl-[acyl-carrier protein] reductase
LGRLANKVAVVTGASRGIGASIARTLAAEGAAVVVNYASSKDGADQVVAAIAADGGTAVAIQGNVSKASDVRHLFDETKRRFGRLDVLVNNAGVFRFAALNDISEELFHSHFNTNVLGLILTTQEAVKLFGPEGGSIINIGSISSTLTPPMSTVYAASKSAVSTITRALAKELGPRKIRVNSINPGLVETDGVKAFGLNNDFRRMVVAQTPLGRIAQPEDIAPLAAFLASAESGWLTGEILFASGGMR